MTTPISNTKGFIDPSIDFEDDVGHKGLLIKHSQEITPEWLDTLKAEKMASTSAPAGEFHRVASIPVVVYEKWLREGYDPTKEPMAKTLAKLSTEGLDHFITTNKSFSLAKRKY